MYSDVNNTDINDDNSSCCGDQGSPEVSSCCQPAPSASRTGKWLKTVIFAGIIVAAAVIVIVALLKPSSGWASLESLDGAFTDHEVVFVVLPGKASQPSKNLAGMMSAVISEIQADGEQPGIMMLQEDAAGYADVVDHFGIKEYPAVLALKKGCNQAVVQGDFSQADLMQAYQKACQPCFGCPASCETDRSGCAGMGKSGS